jgi:tetratricopeptide (TPR) repeat protein
MFRQKHTNVLLACIVASAACTRALAQDGDGRSHAQIFDDIGSFHRAITTDSPQGQAYFDQGLTWVYAFNHDEAIRSFTRVAELDPECAMAWWGVALCQGPNYNDPDMTDERSAAAWEALQKARDRIDNTTPVERALIEALSQRYAKPWPQDRTALEKAYADAMATVWAAYPDDVDVAVLYADAMMVRTPWQLYTKDGKPAQDTPAIVAVLERALKIDPNHPGANHLYIHAVEPSEVPDRALIAASRLCNMVPMSGHLLHMPSHIYVKTGRWEEAVVQNEKAVAADVVYRSLSPDQGIQYMYMVHNAHMLAFAGMMSGREKEAMKAARTMWAEIPAEVLPSVAPYLDLWMCSLYDVQKRFGRWDGILAEPAPPECLPITTAVWRADRAIAYAAKKDFENAEREHKAFREAMAAVPADLLTGQDLAHVVLAESDYFIAGEIALQKEDWELAAELLEKGAEIEDTLYYSEPPQWLQPIRHTLGAVYLSAHRYEDAERAYRQDLAQWPHNGWSLYGLSRALEGQGRTEEARAVDRQYRRAWSHADEMTKTSCKCIPET